MKIFFLKQRGFLRFFILLLIIGSVLFFHSSSVYGTADADKIFEQGTTLTSFDLSCQGGVCVSRVFPSSKEFRYGAVEYTSTHRGFVRVMSSSDWGVWEELQGEADGPDRELHGSQIHFFSSSSGEAFQLKFEGVPSQAVRVTVYDLPLIQEKIKKADIHMAVVEPTRSLVIIPRTQWLDAAIELPFSERISRWPEQYEDVKKIIIHHTATENRDVNGDGLVDSTDYRELVRAIYYFHARTKQWGDIGYQYIIDPDGSVWEGRFGGDGVVGGHATREQLCSKFQTAGVGFNEGSIGISLLGTYAMEQLSPRARESLITLIAQKAWEFEFSPAGSGFFIDADYPNVIAHRDVSCTSCPGDQLYSSLPTLIAEAQSIYEARVRETPRTYAAEYGGPEQLAVELKEGEEKEVFLQFRNTGTASWRRYGRQHVVAASSNVKNHLASLESLHLASLESLHLASLESSSSPSFLQADLITANVAPGQTGVFRVLVSNPPKELETKKTFVLALAQQGWIPKTEVPVTIVNTGLEWAGTVVKKDGGNERTFFDASKTNLVLQFINRGTKEWKKGDVTLTLASEKGSSRLATKQWKKKNGVFAFQEKKVAPGGTATFHIPTYNEKPATFIERLSLLYGKEKISGSDYSDLSVSVKPEYAVHILEEKIPLHIPAATQSMAFVRIKNVGEKPLVNALLKITGKDGKSVSSFASSQWKSKTITETTGTVAPGQVATLSFSLKAPAKAARYTQALTFAQKSRPVYISRANGLYDALQTYSITVDAPLKKKEEVKKKSSNTKKK